MVTDHAVSRAADQEITVGVKSFYRQGKLDTCLRSLLGTHFREVIVADDGEITSEKEAIYEKHGGRLPLKLLRLPYDSGLAYGRNQIVAACGTPYLLMLDDDQQVNSDVLRLKDILRSDDALGGVSGFWLERGGVICNAHDLHVQNGFLLKHLHAAPERHSLGSLTYYLCDQIPNSTLFRLQCLRDLGWDNHYKIGREHVDFSLGHKRLGRWKFAVTPNVLIRHDGSGEGEYGREFRFNPRRLRSAKAYFLQKWGLRGIIEGRKLVNARIPVVRKIETWLTRWELCLPLVAWVQDFEEQRLAGIRRIPRRS